MSAHFDDEATWIAALPPADPEAAAALEHALTCADCARALEHARTLLRALDSLPAIRPDPAALEPIAARVLLDLAEESSARSRRYPAAAIVVTLGLEFVLEGRNHPTGDRVLVAALAAIAALVATWLSGTRARRAVAIAIGASFAIAALAATDPTLAPGLGARCAAFELVSAAVPFAVAAWIARRGGAALGPLRGAAIASSAALASESALELACLSAHGGPHLLVFHLGGVLAAAALGYGGARALDGARRDPRTA